MINWILLVEFESYPIEIPQWLAPKFEAASNNARPIMETAGVIVKGVMKRRSMPIRPKLS